MALEVDEESKLTGASLGDFTTIELPPVGSMAGFEAQLDTDGLRGIKAFEEIELVNRRKGWSKKGLRELRKEKKRTWKRKTGRKRLKYWQRKKKNRDRGAKYYREVTLWKLMEEDNYQHLVRQTKGRWVLDVTREDLDRVLPGWEDMPRIKVWRLKKLPVCGLGELQFKVKGEVVYSPKA